MIRFDILSIFSAFASRYTRLAVCEAFKKITVPYNIILQKNYILGTVKTVSPYAVVFTKSQTFSDEI